METNHSGCPCSKCNPDNLENNQVQDEIVWTEEEIREMEELIKGLEDEK